MKGRWNNQVVLFSDVAYGDADILNHDIFGKRKTKSTCLHADVLYDVICTDPKSSNLIVSSAISPLHVSGH